MTARAFWSSVSLTFRSLLWTLLVPGAVAAGYVPWRFFGLDWAAFRLADPLDVIALLCILAGSRCSSAASWISPSPVGVRCRLPIRHDIWSCADSTDMSGTRCISA
jgi:hypothetical protein